VLTLGGGGPATETGAGGASSADAPAKLLRFVKFWQFVQEMSEKGGGGSSKLKDFITLPFFEFSLKFTTLLLATICWAHWIASRYGTKENCKHILTEQKNIKFSKKYLINIFQSPLYYTRTKHYCSVRIMNYLPS